MIKNNHHAIMEEEHELIEKAELVVKVNPKQTGTYEILKDRDNKPGKIQYISHSSFNRRKKNENYVLFSADGQEVLETNITLDLTFAIDILKERLGENRRFLTELRNLGSCNYVKLDQLRSDSRALRSAIQILEREGS